MQKTAVTTSTSAIRQAFLDYFAERQHEIVESSSLVPGNDPTLLFTNAGMVQFKDVFLGNEPRPYVRATSSQCCVRAGGKHNDLDNVGYTARHHTFFEMLGNFSFGDYFKKEAIEFAWDFLTNVLGIPPEKLWVTVYKDDTEAADIWFNHIKIDQNRFTRCGEKDNFWSMGDTGPCGPCTEIFYDHGDKIPGGPPGSPDEEGDRYVEIWNLVFMQYNRDASGKMTPLPKPSVDTGMGLERIAAVMQGVQDNYDIDLFRHLITAISKLVGDIDDGHTSLRVIADHIRSTAFLLADGVTPSNEGRGYVLRRIIRRAIRHGNKLGLHEPFFHKLLDALVECMGDAYPVLAKDKKRIASAVLREEQQFAKTLDAGMKLLESELTKLSDKLIPGDVVFKLYDTYGFPTDLTADIARERELEIDYAGLDAAMSVQKQRSQAASQFEHDYNAQLDVQGETNFTGYDRTTDTATVTALFTAEGESVATLTAAQAGIIILDQTPFYAEAGGQVGDTGLLQFEGGVFSVSDTRKQNMVFCHYGEVAQGDIAVGQKVDAEVDSSRQATMLNHTATHLLHAALRRVVGEHVIQKGSLVAPARLRFDFAHHSPLTKDEIKAIDKLVNQQIRANLTGHTELMTPKEAMDKGAMALFDEKYGDEVRVLSIGEFSMELCGGTHVKHSGEIGFFKIIGETGIAAGVRRLEALTGDDAIAWVEQQLQTLDDVAGMIKTDRNQVAEKLGQVLTKHRELEKKVSAAQKNNLAQQSDQMVASAQEVGGVKFIAQSVSDIDAKALRDLVDRLKNKLQSGIVLLATVEDDKIRLVAGATKDVAKQYPAGDLVKFVAEQVGGKGGGRPDMAQGGGDKIDALPAAIKSVSDWLQQKSG